MSTSVTVPPAAVSLVDIDAVNAPEAPDAYTTQELDAVGSGPVRAPSHRPAVRTRELRRRLTLAADALAVADLLLGMKGSIDAVGRTGAGP